LFEVGIRLNTYKGITASNNPETILERTKYKERTIIGIHQVLEIFKTVQEILTGH
jgi:hypothetical protein